MLYNNINLIIIHLFKDISCDYFKINLIILTEKQE